MVLHSSLIVLLEIAAMKITSYMRRTLFLIYADINPFNHGYVFFKIVHSENYSEAIWSDFANTQQW